MFDLALFSRRGVLAAGAIAAIVPTKLFAMSAAVDRPAGADGFDFLHGAWRVRHRKLKERLAGSSEWIEFDGTMDVEPFLGGLGNIDQNVLLDPAGEYLATSIRTFDASLGQWSIYWVDGRNPGLDKPVIGRFEGKIGQFFNDDELAGRPIRVRFTYEDLTPSTARWSQAFSPDGGETWETNWTMNFTRGERS